LNILVFLNLFLIQVGKIYFIFLLITYKSWINTFVLNGICLVDDPSLVIFNFNRNNLIKVFDERKEQNGSHHFFQQLFAVPVHCVVCKKTIFMGKTAYKCKVCGLSVHKVCLSETQNNCIRYGIWIIIFLLLLFKYISDIFFSVKFHKKNNLMYPLK